MNNRPTKRKDQIHDEANEALTKTKKQAVDLSDDTGDQDDSLFRLHFGLESSPLIIEELRRQTLNKLKADEKLKSTEQMNSASTASTSNNDPLQVSTPLPAENSQKRKSKEKWSHIAGHGFIHGSSKPGKNIGSPEQKETSQHRLRKG